MNHPRHSQGLIIVCPSGPVQESPKGDHPFQMLIFTLLLPDVLSNYAFIQSSQSDKITPRLNVFSGKILRPALAFPRNRKSTLPFDETDHVRYRVFGPDAQTHVDIICHHMAFNNFTALLFCQFTEHPSQVPPYAKKLLPPPLGHKHNLVFAIPFGTAQTLILSHS